MHDDVFLDERELRSADSFAFRSARLEALDLERVQRHIEAAIQRGRYPENWPSNPVGYLLRRGGAVQVGQDQYPTLAGLVCFGRDPQAFVRAAVVDIGHYRGTESISTELFHLEKNVAGTIFDQLQRMEDYLWKNTHHGMRLNEDSFQRVELHEYPRAVIREVGVNCLAHRDYLMPGTSVRVMLFRDRIQWDTPGGLPPGVTIENILKQQVSRNPIIVKMLFEAGYVEEFGQGLDTVVSVLREEGMEPPHFQDVGAAFIATVYGRKPDAFHNTSLYAHLPDSQQKLMIFLRDRTEVSPRELYEFFKNERTERSLQRDIDQLIDAKLVEATGAGKARRIRLYIKNNR
ncbi:MAG: hypothetical protein M3R24_32080 [Chloroflexota bacterium]|nr:hypothetical protein [Chloroflexota bacterium]